MKHVVYTTKDKVPAHKFFFLEDENNVVAFLGVITTHLNELNSLRNIQFSSPFKVLYLRSSNIFQKFSFLSFILE